MARAAPGCPHPRACGSSSSAASATVGRSPATTGAAAQSTRTSPDWLDGYDPNLNELALERAICRIASGRRAPKHTPPIARHLTKPRGRATAPTDYLYIG